MKQKTGQKKGQPIESTQHYRRCLAPALRGAPWVLRVTDHKDRTPPVMVIKQRRRPEEEEEGHGRPYLVDRGVLWGDAQRRLLPVVRAIVGRVLDGQDQPLELQQYLTGNRISFRGNLPLDDEAGLKLALIMKLRERVREDDRSELIARRIDCFTREEAAYWFSRITHFGADANRWAIAGLRIVLGGQPHDPAIARMLEGLR